MFASLLSKIPRSDADPSTSCVRPILWSLGIKMEQESEVLPKPDTHTQIHRACTLRKWDNAVQVYYPHCHLKLMQIYEALGLTPLICDVLDFNTELTQDTEVLLRVNKLIQKILEPLSAQSASNDAVYIQRVQQRLEQAYQDANLPFTRLTKPITISIKTLRDLLSEPLSTANPIFDTEQQNISDLRGQLSYVMEYRQSSDCFLLSCLSILAQDLEALSRHFTNRIFIIQNDKPYEINREHTELSFNTPLRQRSHKSEHKTI